MTKRRVLTRFIQMKRPEIVCTKCKGHGTQLVPKRLMSCLKTIARLKGPKISDIHASLGEDIDVTAVNHRVNQLVGLGLVTHIGNHRPKRYKIASK